MIKRLCTLATLLVMSYQSQAFNVTVPLTEDAKVFAKYVEDYPVVVNYYSQASEQEIIDFYTEQYGPVMETINEKQRTRVIFMHEGKVATIIISAQGKAQQVDILIR